MLTIDKFLRTARKCGFKIEDIDESQEDFDIEMQQYTPAGEDWWTTLSWNKNEDIRDKLQEYINGWDSDEEAEIWINMRGKNGVPSSIRELIDDQDWKLEQLKKLQRRLKAFKR